MVNARCKEVKPGSKKFKKNLAKVVFWFLGRGFQVVAKYDNAVKDEVSTWKDGMKILLRVEPNGPCMAIEKQDGKVRYIGSMETEAELTIYIKNIEAAMEVLLGRKGIVQAFAEHRFTLKGDIAEGMRMVRCLNIVEAYLFPKFISRNILKTMPHKTSNGFKVYMGIIFGVN